MGSFNVVCNVSNQVLSEGRKVVNVFTLKNNRSRDDFALVNVTDEYTPISFPFIAVYADYGRFELVPNMKQNKIAWDLFTLYLKEDKNKFPEVLHEFIENLTKQEDEDAFYNYFMEHISDFRSTALSFMTIDFNIHENMIARAKSEPTPYQTTGTLQERAETYFSNDYLPRANKILEDMRPYVRFLKLREKLEHNDTLTLDEQEEYTRYEEDNLRIYDMFTVISRFEDEEMSDVPIYRTVAYNDFFTSYHSFFYVYFTNKYAEDHAVLNIFIDGYAFYIAMKTMHVPYRQCVIGSQTENFEMVAESIAGTVKSLRQELINLLEIGSDFLDDIFNLTEEFWKTATSEKIEQLVNELSTDDVLAIFRRM